MPASFTYRPLALLALLALALPAALTPRPAAAANPPETSPAKPPEKLYELRLETAAPGKLADLHARFRDHTLKLFEKHGMENILYCTVSEGAASDDAKNMLVYILAHKDRATADASWKALLQEPDWQAVQTKSEAAGKLLAQDPVSIFMNTTDFSPAQEPPTKPDAPARIFELRKYNTGPAGLPGTVDRMRSGEADLFTKSGMTTLHFWTAADDSAFIYLLAHKDRPTSRASWQTFFADFRKFQTEFNARRTTRPAVTTPATTTRPATTPTRTRSGGSEIRFLIPTDYSPRK